MRTMIEIDNDMMEKALKSGPYKRKKEVIAEGLKLLVERNNQRKIREYRGKLKWEGNLEQSRVNL